MKKSNSRCPLHGIIPPAIRQSSSYISSDKSGFILAFVLIMLGIIVALVLQTQMLARSCLNLENRRLLQARLRLTAGDNLWQALNVLAADPDLLSDHTNEEWALPINIRLTNGIEAEAVIIDENRFVDANMLAYISPPDPRRPAAAIVHDLLAAESFPNPEQQTQTIKDWIDQDLNGSYETDYYQRKHLQVDAPNLSMESREELLWLTATATNSAPVTALTVLPGQIPHIEPVNINTASPQALLALFGADNAVLVERIIRARGAAPLPSPDNIVGPLLLQKIAPYIAVRSSFFSVYSRAQSGNMAQEVYCLAKRDSGGNIQILRWVEH